MRKIIACLGVLGISACASHEADGRHTTARAEDRSVRHTHHDADGVAVVDPADPAHDRVIVDGRKVAVDGPAAKVEPVPIAAVSPTALNERDRDSANRAPADSHASASDADITRRIRKAVVSDDNLTAAAKNVKIATEDGRVTLRGNVHDTREKDTVESHARDVAGAGNVKNQIDVAN